ncbi:Chondroitin polymerase [Chlamydia abortus]|uniref:Glycosyltransferase family 2 protein n=1 Tax=Paenibacillus residui TaxID=629724 RepID=A0ABW3D8T5_9BACL|nr:Chondroitin polymerase [Chlamydia abortus]
MTMTSIIIPTYNGRELLAACIQSIRSSTSSPYELIVVDNGSVDGTAEYCREEQLTYVGLPDNRGFPAACNIGLRLAKGSSLMLLNNDVVVTGGWLERLLEALHSAPDIGIVGPCSNRVSGSQKVRLGYASMEQFHCEAHRYMEARRGIRTATRRLTGFCFLFRRELWERIGELDERFTPGYYEDDDYCYRARRAGYRLLIARDAYVHHIGSASFRRHSKRSKLLYINRRKFIRKWGVHPHRFI